MRVSFVVPVLVAALMFSACSGPHAAAKNVGGAGAILAIGGGSAWVIGARSDSNAVMVPGVIGVVAGVIMMVAAGMMMAGEVACRADADCAIGHQCREVPMPAGRIPYSQCVPR